MRLVLRALALWAGWAVLISANALLVRRIAHPTLYELDHALLEALAPLATPGLERWFALPSLAGTWQLYVPLVGASFVALSLRDRTAAREFLIVIVGSAQYALLNRILFSRERPLSVFGEQFEHDAFPSGHALLLLSFALALWLVVPIRSRAKKIATGCCLIAAALLLSVWRLVIGAHYPSDVLAGWVLATGWVLGMLRLLRVRRRLSRASPRRMRFSPSLPQRHEPG